MKTRRQSFFLNVTMLSMLIACFALAFVEVGFADDHAAKADHDASASIEQTSSDEDSGQADVDSSEEEADATTPFGDDGEEQQVEEEQDDGPVCHGVVTCTFYATGQVLKVPFRILGGLIDFLI